MTNGGKQLRELIRARGFRLGAVAKAIDVSYETMRTWNHTAPIDKLIKISDFCHIDILDIINCFRSDRSDTATDPLDQN